MILTSTTGGLISQESISRRPVVVGWRVLFAGVGLVWGGFN